LDSSLNIKFRAHTIDTIQTAQIKIGEIETSNQITLSAPPLFVNRQSCAYNSQLFINSRLKSDNETIKAFRENDVIDVYSLTKGQYLRSFYLPLQNSESLREFRVVGNKIILL
jgi:hypothetical protein